MASPWVQIRASQAVLLILAFQIPLFKSVCRTGICEAPLEVMVGQLTASFPQIPPDVRRLVLYPGATTRQLIKSFRSRSPFMMPEWDSVLSEFNMDSSEKEAPVGEYRLEVMAGSYFVVGGAVQAMWRSGRMGVLGLMLVAFGLYKQGAFETPADPHAPENAKMYPMFIVLAILTFLTLRLDRDKVDRLTSSVKIGPKRPKQKVK